MDHVTSDGHSGDDRKDDNVGGSSRTDDDSENQVGGGAKKKLKMEGEYGGGGNSDSVVAHVDAGNSGGDENDVNRFLCIPDEIFVGFILPHLGQSDLHRMAQVNRRFFVLCRDATLWTELDLPWWDSGLDTRGATRVLDRCGDALKKLTLTSMIEIDCEYLVVHALMFCPNLEELTIDNYDLDDDDDQDDFNFGALLKNVNKYGQNLRRLHMNIYVSLKSVRQNPASLKNLTHVTFLGNELGDEGLRGLANHCNNLQYLDNRNDGDIGGGAMKYFLKRVRSKLEFLRISCVANWSVNVYAGIGGCHLLNTLFFETLRGVDRAKLSAALTTLPNLKSLALLGDEGESTLTGEDVTFVFGGGNFKKLQTLSLRRVPEMQDVGLVSIASACPKLSQLYLYNCSKGTDAGIRHVLFNCYNLKHLLLWEMKKWTWEVFATTEIRAPLEKLSFFKLMATQNIGKEVAKEILLLLPTLKSMDYEGEITTFT